MKIYTRTGDGGETTLYGGGRVPKNHPRVVACGAVDELNAFLGRALGPVRFETSRSRLGVVQHDLFCLGAHLAFSGERAGGAGPALPELPESRPAEMEAWIDEVEAELAPLTRFILPGGADAAAELHVCRTVCRRAERAVVGIGASDPSTSFAVRYLNRLADLLFVFARLENRLGGLPDVPWRESL